MYNFHIKLINSQQYVDKKSFTCQGSINALRTKRRKEKFVVAAPPPYSQINTAATGIIKACNDSSISLATSQHIFDRVYTQTF